MCLSITHIKLNNHHRPHIYPHTQNIINNLLNTYHSKLDHNYYHETWISLVETDCISKMLCCPDL